ncbi:unnamed protein product, partial [marine sediment metagenome]
NNLGTPEDNGVINRTVTVITEAVNDDPTLDALSEVTINEDAPEQTVNLTGITAGGGETQVLSITAVSDNTGLIPDPTVDFDGQSSTGTLKFTPVADQFGTATITVTVEDGGLDDDLGTPEDNGSILRTVVVRAEAVNDAPTLDALSDIKLNEDDDEQTVNLTGITAGGGETQGLRVTSVSDNTGLIPDPTVTFDGQSSTGTLKFTPVADQFGTATITVTVEDGGLDNDLGTPGDNGVVNRTVFIAVEPVNDDPTLIELSESTLIEDFGTSTVQLTGITAGPNETQDLLITALSSDANVISIGNIDFVPSSNAIEWTVENGGNGHFYEHMPTHMSWDAAQAYAVERGGYLATLTSSAESEFVHSLVPVNDVATGFIGDSFIGGYQDRTGLNFSEPLGGWQWVTGEEWSFDNWQSGNPDNQSDIEHYLHFFDSGEWG